MSSTETKLLNSLTSYVLDVKPYHTKLKELTTELFFEEDMSVAIVNETFAPKIFLQNVWGKTDIGGWRLQDVSDGERVQYQIPAFLVPRFSLNDALGDGQEPAFDPATLEIDANSDGFPDEYPWSRAFSWSHQVGVTNEVPVDIVDFEALVINASQAPIPSDSSNIYRARITYDLRIEYNPQNLYGIDFTAPTVRLNDTVVGYSTISTSPTKIVLSIVGLTMDVTITSTYQPEHDLLTYLGVRGDSSVYLNFFKQRIFQARNRVSITSTGETGRYRLPTHNGSRVYVNQALQTLGSQYVVDKTRGFIQFLPGFRPTLNQRVDINYFLVDRFFISINYPFDHHKSLAFDEFGYDEFPYDGADSILADDDQADYFIVEADFSRETYCREPIFYNLYPDKIKGRMIDARVYPTAGSSDAWSIKATSSKTFDVQKFGSPIVEKAFFGKVFDNGELTFLITNTWVDYYITDDNNSFKVHNLSAYGIDTSQFGFDMPDHQVDQGVAAARGSIENSALNCRPYDINPYGVIKRIGEVGAETYVFEFFLPPEAGQMIEFRIEQAEQYNQHVHASIFEKVKFFDRLKFNDGLCSTAVQEHGYFQVGFDIPHLDVLPMDDVEIGQSTFEIDLTTTETIDVASLMVPTCLNPIVNEDDSYFFPYIEEEVMFTQFVGNDVVDGSTPVYVEPYSVKTIQAKLHKDATVYKTNSKVHELILFKDVGTTPVTVFPTVTVYDGTVELVLGLDYTISFKNVEFLHPSTTTYGYQIFIGMMIYGTATDPDVNDRNLVVTLI